MVFIIHPYMLRFITRRRFDSFSTVQTVLLLQNVMNRNITLIEQKIQVNFSVLLMYEFCAFVFIPQQPSRRLEQVQNTCQHYVHIINTFNNLLMYTYN